MRKSTVVKDYLANIDKDILFKEFSERVSKPISSAGDLAELYAILVALTFKKGEDIQGFFKYVAENIKFEWFSKIANYYLSNQSTSDSFTFNTLSASHTESVLQQNNS
jgi:hypothetical protein